MTLSQYGTAELQGDASPSPPKPYMSRVAKIALALIACGGAAVLADPVTRPTTINFALDKVNSLSLVVGGDDQRSGGAAPVKSTPLKATGGGSGNSRGRLTQANILYFGGEGGGR